MLIETFEIVKDSNTTRLFDTSSSVLQNPTLHTAHCNPALGLIPTHCSSVHREPTIVAGDHIYGWLGDVVDILSVIVTMMGVCTSLGLGAGQLNFGLHRINSDIVKGDATKFVIIWIVTGSELPVLLTFFACFVLRNILSFWTAGCKTLPTRLQTAKKNPPNVHFFAVTTLSVASGVNVGIRRLSEVCFSVGEDPEVRKSMKGTPIWLRKDLDTQNFKFYPAGSFILLVVLITDDTWYLLNLSVQSGGHYVHSILPLGYHTGAQVTFSFTQTGQIKEVEGMAFVETFSFFLSLLLAHFRTILFSDVSVYYWPIFGQYCFQTCRFIYLLLADFPTILFSDVSVYFILFIYFFFSVCLFVCLFVCLYVSAKAFKPDITAECPLHHRSLVAPSWDWPKMVYLGHTCDRHLGFWWKTRFGASWPPFSTKVNHLGVCCRASKALQNISRF